MKRIAEDKPILLSRGYSAAILIKDTKGDFGYNYEMHFVMKQKRGILPHSGNISFS
jgi:hypothetical protein